MEAALDIFEGEEVIPDTEEEPRREGRKSSLSLNNLPILGELLFFPYVPV